MKKEEGNKLIAEFMGFEYDRSLPAHGGGTLITFSIKDVVYHASWDWLMPVVEKINEMEFSFEIDTWVGVTVYDYSKNFRPESLIEVLKEDEDGNKISTIKSVWLAVIEFIKWYNQNKQQ